MKTLSNPPCNNCVAYPTSGLYSGNENEVNPQKRIVLLKKGEKLFHEKEEATHICCVQSGKLILSKTNPNNQEEILKIACQGDMLGLDSLVFDKHYLYTAAACDNCVVCKITREEFYKQNTQHPEILFNLLKRFTRVPETSYSVSE